MHNGPKFHPTAASDRDFGLNIELTHLMASYI